jgi:hypothetical protein
LAVVNLVFNPEILSKYGKSSAHKSEQEALIGLAFQYCQQENPGVVLDTETFEILKDTLCCGNLEYQVSRLTNESHAKKMSDLDMAKEALGGDTAIPDSILNKIGGLNVASSGKELPCRNLIEEVDSNNNLPSYEEKLISSGDGPSQKVKR